MYQIWRYIRD